MEILQFKLRRIPVIVSTPMNLHMKKSLSSYKFLKLNKNLLVFDSTAIFWMNCPVHATKRVLFFQPVTIYFSREHDFTFKFWTVLECARQSIQDNFIYADCLANKAEGFYFWSGHLSIVPQGGCFPIWLPNEWPITVTAIFLWP